ncbi:lysophospholipid acyltransferase family protein [Frankia sp. Cppng1_Ct_nod]|uniref:lysophospholipid acyltransferase family protein n=1 Tax=Frankia sp. Cppng1_Ct_nod TaxID=2897162 RepID=UPI0013EF7267|nr:lysophospholipid acyltransferase family protein [Frankia sp. Cppng1_Ct_nod]
MSEARIIPLGSKDGRARTGGGAARRSRPPGSSDIERGTGVDQGTGKGAVGDEVVVGRRMTEHLAVENRESDPDPDGPTASGASEANPAAAGAGSTHPVAGDGGSTFPRGTRGAGERATSAGRMHSSGHEAGDVDGEPVSAVREPVAGLGRGDPPDDPDVGPTASLPSEPLADAGSLEQALAGFLAFLRRRITGDYVVDEHGFDQDLTENVIAPLLRPIYQNYFRVETRGLENVPDIGGALIVANHSGTVPMDAIMTALAIMDHHPAHRHLRILAADLVFAVPFLAPMARKTGNTLACQADAERLLAGGHLVGVWPEGFKGVGKPFSERYKLQRFGRGGFVSAALRTGVPIVPCTIVGAEEIYPMIGNLKTLARLLGLPYLPITPTFPWLGLFGLLPLPSKWLIEFGEPVDTESLTPAAAEDPMLVFELTDRVRETIQHSLYGLLMQRRSVFF